MMVLEYFLNITLIHKYVIILQTNTIKNDIAYILILDKINIESIL